MARKVIDITVPADGGRDAGKRFRVVEMPSSQGERWATRALMAMVKAGHDITDETLGAGMMGFARYGLKAFLSMDYLEAEALLAEMMRCVKLVYDPNHPEATRELIEDDLEEIPTRLMLRREVFKLHVGFSPAAVSLISAMEAAARERSTGTSTSTSNEPSAP